MLSIARYFRFVLIVVLGELLLASSYIFTKPHITTAERWLALGRLLLMLLVLYGLNYALQYGRNPVRNYLSQLPVWQNRAWRVAANVGIALTLVSVLHWLNEALFNRPFSPLPSMRAEILSFVPMMMQVMLMHALFELSERTQRMAMHNEVLKRDQSEARLEALKQQVSPHFLFNSFATLNWLIRENPTAAERFVHKMAQVYRYVLQQSERKWVTLGEEMTFVESYLYLLHMRFEQNLQVIIDIPSELQALRLPPMAIQTVLENAVKHNVISQDQPLTMYISAVPGVLTVRNTLQPRLAPEATSGVGLKNLNARFHFLGGAGLVAQPLDGHFTVTLPLFT